MTDPLEEVVRQTQLGQQLEDALLSFFASYRNLPSLPENINDLFATYVRLVQKEVSSPKPFAHFHEMERSPFDFYAFTLDMIRPLLDFASSKVFGEENLRAIDAAIARNENVILLANHQAEIDPQIISLLIAPAFPKLAQSIAFVAGHRVTSDPLAIPFSRGTNLFSIYSKKYIENPPEEKGEKLRHNAKTLIALEERLAQGGLCLYVAPSGGRDRYDSSGEVKISPFDASSVEIFYLIARRAKVKTHLHLLALSTIKLLPPPHTVNLELGEERLVSYGPASLFFGPELPLEAIQKDQRQAKGEALTEEIVKMTNAMSLHQENKE